MAVVYKNAGLFTFAIFALRDSGVKPLGFIIYLKKYIFHNELRNKSPFYTLFTPLMMSNRQLPIYIHLILSIKLSL